MNGDCSLTGRAQSCGLRRCEFKSRQLPNMKICAKCKKSLTKNEFDKDSSRKDNLSRICKDCRRNYYLERHLKYKIWFKEYRQRLKCKECNEKRWYVLDFHHKDSSNKEMSICRMVNSHFSIDRILKEMKKCKILCANCHRTLHYNENLNK